MIKINEILTKRFSKLALAAICSASLGSCAGTAIAQGSVPDRGSMESDATFADLATLAEAGDLVIRAAVTDQIALPPERAPDVAPGYARFYIEAETLALIAGSTPVGEDLAYLVDVPLSRNGDLPDFEDREVLLFAKPVPGKPGAIQLVGPSAQLLHSPALEARLRPILSELFANDVPPEITGIKDALAVPGTLTGESETQIFLETRGSSPVSITVLRRPGQPPAWGVSWGEIVDSSARPPEPDTLRWYRLACSLPEGLPAGANLASDPQARALAQQDYAFVREQLGDCERVLTEEN